MLRPHLEQNIDEGARLEVIAVEPLVEDVEDREQSVLWSGAATLSLGFDVVSGPALLAKVEEREHKVVL